MDNGINLGTGVVLKNIAEKNLPKLLEWRNSPEVFSFCRQNDVINEITHRKWYEWQAEDKNTRMYEVIHDGKLIGVCGFTSIEWIVRRAEFSLYLGPEFQGKKLSQPVLKTLFTHGFRNLNLNLIWGETFNDKAARVFEQIGMTKDGIRRDFYYKKGIYLNATLYSIKGEEWSKIHQL